MHPLQTASSQKIFREAETENPAALSSSLIHTDFQIVWWK